MSVSLRRRAAAVLSAEVGLAALAGPVAAPAGAAEGPAVRPITIPGEGGVSFSADVGDPRSGGRAPQGNH
ncbi:MAG: hypothetical protein ACT4PX_08885, partial [Actinomycetota bacterium]